MKIYIYLMCQHGVIEDGDQSLEFKFILLC